MHKREGPSYAKARAGISQSLLQWPRFFCLCMESDLLPPCNQLYPGTLLMKDRGNIDCRRTRSQHQRLSFPRKLLRS